MNELTHLDLFSGLGGFSLAAQWAGFRTVAFCESDSRCRGFLGKTWGLPVHPDARTLDGRKYRGVSLLTGGPPCQPASRAGNQRGCEDDRWLWDEALRVLEEAQPDSVVFENPPGILDVGIDGILSEMGRLGYEVQCFDIPACAVDSPQLRHRIWIIGFMADAGRESCERGQAEQDAGGIETRGRDQAASDIERSGNLADAERERRERRSAITGEAKGGKSQPKVAGLHWANSVWVPCADNHVRRAPDDSVSVVNGLHRSLLGALGNSIVPALAYEILKAVRETIEKTTTT